MRREKTFLLYYKKREDFKYLFSDFTVWVNFHWKKLFFAYFVMLYVHTKLD